MDAEDFIATVLQHVPPKGKHLTRYYGLYSSRSRWKWEEKEFLEKIFPQGFREGLEEKEKPKDNNESKELAAERVALKKRNSAWRRLICRVYEVDPMICPKCGSEMRVMAIITDPLEVNKILNHLLKIGRLPPGIENYSLVG